MRARVAAFLKIDAAEVPPLAWAFFYFFCLLCAYYILRPVREEMAIEGGVQHLPWLMTATFLALLAATPVFGWLSARLPRSRLLPVVYVFFAGNLILFYLSARSPIDQAWVARTFFVWLSVFNLFVVSVFWSFMVDLFSADQGRRLFGIIAAGGSAGALVGPAITAFSTYVFPIAYLMVVSAGLLLICVLCIRRLDRWAQRRTPERQRSSDAPIGGQVLAGIRLAMSSPYLAGICGYLLVLSMTATVLYLEQAQVVGREIGSPAERTRLYAGVDVTVSALTFITQVFLTNRIALRAALVFLPAASLVGFAIMGLHQTVAVFVTLIVIRRVSEYALAKPGREVLFTVLSREEKYKAKNFIDTAVSRGGDAATGWLVAAARAWGATTAGLLWTIAPVLVLWCWLGWWLAGQVTVGRRERVGMSTPIFTG